MSKPGASLYRRKRQNKGWWSEKGTHIIDICLCVYVLADDSCEVRGEDCREGVLLCLFDKNASFQYVHALQRKSHLCIPFQGIARPQPQFPHSCVCERFIWSQYRSTYFLQQNRQTDCGDI
jgi:hypothetical protein